MNFSFIRNLKTSLRLVLNKLRLSKYVNCIGHVKLSSQLFSIPLGGLLTGTGEPAPSATLLQDGSFTLSRIGGKYDIVCRYWCQYWADDVGVLQFQAKRDLLWF